ncbi:MAG TPA: hemerythrin domain-containing protein [Noviherbaspirillum sp.]|uniref:hemerythrin domain-containing protein n=1 Tax=Noviherbaspirillum sp. TaxID=1926288 RepID=UPI002B45E230|nr:hemerythrin domain-containing protein [Noviherbaspirillum sp.]HJV88592.1 hemerythrin domain-containing protein [Noviherbaspirillum sp.]
MNIDKFKHQHVEILSSISVLRALVKSGIGTNAEEIARRIISMSSTIKLHLAVEDKVLYPALKNTGDSTLTRMGQRYQDEMTGIAHSYLDFARRWNTAHTLTNKPEEFRADANNVLRVLYDRMCRENTEFYPAIEAY